MPSPFPGMDPYLEQPAIWPDFHAKFINYLQEAIGDRLPDNYDARIDEWVRMVEVATGETAGYKPDVAISQDHPLPDRLREPVGTLTLEPVSCQLVVGTMEVSEYRIEVIRRSDLTLITAVELLSPTNKGSSGHGAYLSKRTNYLRRGVHLVEIDFLVGGTRPPINRPWPAGEYNVLVADATRRPNADIYSWSVRQPLPPIPIPLRLPDPRIVVPLQEVFATVYERGRYRRALDYSKPPLAPLQPDDLAWATRVAASAGR